jgi:radical SAM superfamily enzyme YgiQ (UPF0313 family)
MALSTRVMIVSLNQQRFVHPVPPIGALYLAGGLRERGHEVRFVDLMFASDAKGEIKKAFLSFRPDLIGIAIRNVDSLISRTEFSIPALQSCVEAIRQYSTAPSVLGGPGYSLFPTQILNSVGLDLGIAGEADQSFPDLVERIAEGRPYTDIPGLCYRREGGIVSNPPGQVASLDTIPFQAIDLIDAKKYDRYRGAMGVFTRKACPFSCIYCPEAALHRNQVRLRSPKKVADEIEYIIRQTGVNYFDFADTTFNVPQSHSLAVCDSIRRRGLDFQFEVELNPIGQNDNFVRVLKETGCKGVDLTVESGSNRMLHTLKKGFTTEDAIQAAKLYRKHRIPYTAGFLLGGPGEDRDSIRETIEFARRLPEPNAVYFTVGLRVFSQTELFEYMKRLDPSLKEESLLYPRFYVSESFDESCAELLLDACRKHRAFYISDIFYKPVMRWVVQGSNFMNVRPAWKMGGVPKIFQQIVQLGANGLQWDEASRAFV